jgi:dUTP pyrophosphatase
MKSEVTIQVKKLSAEATLPQYAKIGDAGMDVCACLSSPVCVDHGERVLIPTGLAFAVPLGFEMQIRPRSGLALKHGITVLNSPGTLDSGYRGELKVILFNTSSERFTVNHGDRIAQVVINELPQAHLEEVSILPDSDRGAGGFGSTGK